MKQGYFKVGERVRAGGMLKPGDGTVTECSDNMNCTVKMDNGHTHRAEVYFFARIKDVVKDEEASQEIGHE